MWASIRSKAQRAFAAGDLSGHVVIRGRSNEICLIYPITPLQQLGALRSWRSHRSALLVEAFGAALPALITDYPPSARRRAAI